MIGKLMGMLATLIAAVCVATVIAAAVLIAYYAQSWKVTSERAGQAMAILQGKSPESFLPPPPPKKQADSEQPAFDERLAAQNLKTRDLEQRETLIRANIQQFQQELDKIDAERKRVAAVRDDLQAKLEEMNNSAATAGMGAVSDTMATLKPKQAKELIKQQLDKGQTDVVVRLLMSMSDGKRAKIIAEFNKDAHDLEQIGEVLNRIREGQPTAQLVDETGKKLQPPRGPGT
jgi:peptidyl-tRNA hydrolase